MQHLLLAAAEDLRLAAEVLESMALVLAAAALVVVVHIHLVNLL